MKALTTLRVNGTPHTVAVDQHWTLLEVLRYKIGLTGSKQGCDKGDCASCTVLVDGEPTLSCCTLAVTSEGKEIVTIEGLADQEGPTRLQRAFDASGAMQCGFCQPGIILSASKLLQDNPDPTRLEISKALSAHLCRCTGYTKIIDAVCVAAREPISEKRQMSAGSAGHKVLGADIRRYGTPKMASGNTKFTDDLVFPGLLVGKLLRSPHAHARILSINTDAALAIEGVHAVLIGDELPITFGIIPWTPDETALAVGKVRHVGEAVAAVAAVDEETADAALKAIVVKYEVLTPILSPQEALAPDAPLIHETDWKGRERKDNNCKTVELSFGDVDQALADAAVTISGEWHYSGNTHAAIEPHCAIGDYTDTDDLVVYSSTQVAHYLHRELAKVLSIDEARIRVIQPPVGGAFGGKSEPFDLEFAVAALSRKCRRPVKILYTREEVFYAHRGRHPADFNFTLTTNAEGLITAVDNDILLDGGAYHSFGLITTYYAGQLLCGPLDFGSYRYRSRRAYTNKPACGPKRGHGSVQPRFPLETALDEAAEQLGMDPIEIRRKNALPATNATTINGQKINTNGVLQCLEKVETASDWVARYANMPKGRGLGVATSMYISGTAYPIYPNKMPQSSVMVRADRSGRINIHAGVNEIGQGSDTVLAIILSEETGVPLEQISVFTGDSDLTPVDLGAYSSRVTLMAGTAAKEAGEKLGTFMRDALSKKLDIEASQLDYDEKGWFDTKAPEERHSTTSIIQLVEADIGAVVVTGGYWTEEGLGGGYRGGSIGASPAYSATAHVAEVSVDMETGVVKVHKMWAAHDCGYAINPIAVQGQIEGSVYMGVSEALHEELIYDEKGLNVDPSLLGYRIHTSMDVPEIEAMIVETHDPAGPYGAKEAGEGPLHAAIPAIANAIWHATGVRMRTMPFTPDRVLAAIREGQKDA